MYQERLHGCSWPTELRLLPHCQYFFVHNSGVSVRLGKRGGSCGLYVGKA